ncbi:general secretion pathway protein GspB [Shewanella sp. AS1]|uniref:general secretion pathway protein GspB n=1 Tax=Shewanella sp. AS1 TaxID=2907626 RepID=UPI001F2473D6|nr:general secretion pathway protein GspB [Shewanella sp. AS1]MCE9677924.1 general secretion pathway protein GspB [Shewanella sp. AS1]
MSILLDAVSRAKQQSQSLDPVITPRAQLQNLQQGNRLWLKLLLFVCLLLLAVASAWLLSRANVALPVQPLQTQPSQSQLSNSQASQRPAFQAEASQTYANKSEPIAREPNARVQLAGKVALPVAVERPGNGGQQPQPQQAQTQKTLTQRNLAAGSATIAMATQEESGDEPIILGANSNRRGQELLSSLKAQVEQAANEVGLESSSVPNSASDREPKLQTKEDLSAASAEPSDQLLAAFQSALSEVEKDNALAKPVTEPKLDPIPTPKPDQLPKYGQLPAGLQLQVPQFNILAHVYSSDPQNRWLNVDGVELQEGDSIGGKLKVIEIRPRDVVLQVADTQFKVPAI